MEHGVQGSTNKDHNRSQHSYMKMLQTQAPSSSYNTDHITSPIPSNNHSRMITKQPHKTRIIHIVPPEIIQTDKANFRDLVQSLTGQSSSSASNTGRVKKHQMPQVSLSDINTNYLLGFDGSNSNSSNNHPEQLSLDVVASNHEILNGGFQAKVEREEEIVVQNRPLDASELGMKDNNFENGFCIDGFLELDEWPS